MALRGPEDCAEACRARRRFTNQAVARRVCARQGSAAGEDPEEREKGDGLRSRRLARVRRPAPCHRASCTTPLCSSASSACLCSAGVRVRAGHEGRCVPYAVGRGAPPTEFQKLGTEASSRTDAPCQYLTTTPAVDQSFSRFISMSMSMSM